jgi:MFS superfamily sulfate permease-like transporter
MITMLMLLVQLSRPEDSVLGALTGTSAFVDAARHPEATTDPSILIFRLDAPLLFINATWMRDSLRDRLRRADPPPRVVVIDMQQSSDLDIQGLNKLTQVADDLSEQGIELRLANVHGQVHEMLRRGGLADKIGEARIYRTMAEAVG